MADGHARQAEILLRQALEIFQAIDAADARPLAELDARTSRGPQGKARHWLRPRRRQRLRHPFAAFRP
jgi:hypothetical protein